MTQRPNMFSDEIVDVVAEQLLPQLLQWAERSEDDKEYKAQLKIDLTYALKWRELDGFRLAKTLDDLGWDADQDLVSILDQACTLVLEEYKNVQIKWVDDNNLKPKFSEGDRVNFMNETGTIKHVATKTLKYHVKLDSSKDSSLNIVCEENLTLIGEEK